jgi:hypothetical protein
MDKVEIGVNKLKTTLGALGIIAIGIAPAHFIDFNNLTPQDIILPPIACFMFYCSYRYFIKRLLMGPIITLTKDSMTVKNDDMVNTYRWTTIKKVKVELVTEKNMEGQDVSHTMLTVWTTTKDKPDAFHISDLEMNIDEIRELINNYTNGTAANKMFASGGVDV